MKSIFLLCLFCTLSLFSQNSSKKIRVLFLGNSYVYFNDLPMVIANIASSKGDTMLYDSNCPGGFTFNNHANDFLTQSKIAIGSWDYVVLQAQSQEPSFPPNQVNSQTLPYALKLDSMIKLYNPCATTVFFETWGRKNGDAGNCAFYPPLCTYSGMQDRLKQSYKLFADSTKAIIAPAGEAFRSVITNSPSVELYIPDQSHPSLYGTYLTAAVFYETLFQRSVLNSTYTAGIDTSFAAFFQEQASKTVRDSLAVWNLGHYTPWAQFSIDTLSSVSFKFNSASPSINNWWYFGDGNTSSNSNPTHTYIFSGTYTVSHVVSYGCRQDSVVQTIDVFDATDLIETKRQNALLGVFPNPCQDYVRVTSVYNSLRPFNFELYDVLGQKINIETKGDKLLMHDLKSGIYFLKVNNEEQPRIVRIIKE